MSEAERTVAAIGRGRRDIARENRVRNSDAANSGDSATWLGDWPVRSATSAMNSAGWLVISTVDALTWSSSSLKRP